MVDDFAYEFVNVTTKMLCKECYRRGIPVDDDLIQSVLLFVWDKIVRRYDDKRAKWTTYAWRVIDSFLKDLLIEKSKKLEIVSFEDILCESDCDNKIDHYFADTYEESFSSKLLKLLAKYSDLGQDFLKLITGDVDVSNALRSIKVSKRKGEDWIEWWLGRKLTDEERRCCGEIKMLLRMI
jgi:hypothetical protein